MIGVLGANLVILSPGALRQRLLALAVFRRRGRVPKGEHRLVRFYGNTSEAIWLPRGLLPRVVRMAPLQVVDRRLVVGPVAFGWRGALREEQYAAVAHVIAQDGGLLIAPPGAGKTECGLAAIAQWQQPALWLAHTRDLTRQALERARRLFHLPRSAFGYIGEGEVAIGSHITVAMIQTLVKHPHLIRELAPRVGAVVQDEAQHVAALTFARVVSQFAARYRLGLSATPDRTDGLGPLVHAVVGPGVTRIGPRLLVERRRLVMPAVRLVSTAFRHWGEGDWFFVQRSRAFDPGRNALLCALAAREARAGRRVLVLVEMVRHARLIAHLLRQRFGVPAASVVGATEAAVRRQAYQRVEAGPFVLVATKLADEGLDLPALDCLILGAAGRSLARLQQQIGRVMRVWKNKRDAWVYDLCDLLVPSLADQARQRVAFYQSVGLRVERQW